MINKQKSISLLLVLLLLMSSLSACGGKEKDGRKIKDKTKKAMAELHAFQEEKKAEKGVTSEDPDEDTTDPSDQNDYIMLYQDVNFTLRYMYVDDDGVHFEVWNDTNETLVFTASSLAINRKSFCDVGLSGEDADDVQAMVGPGSTGEFVAKCDVDPSEKVGEIAGQFRIRAYQNYDFEAYHALIENTVIDPSVSVNTPDVEGTLLYEDDHVRVAFKEVERNNLVLCVENRTEENISLWADSVSVNGRSLRGLTVMDTKNVAPLSVGEIGVTCDLDAATTVGQMSGQFTLIQSDKYNSKDMHFEIPFDTVVIDGSIEADTTPEGMLIHEEEFVRICYKEINDTGIVFDVENLSEYPITFIPDCVAINRQSFNNLMASDKIAPHSAGTVTVECDFSPSTPVAELSAYIRVQYKVGANSESLRFSIPTVLIDESVSVELYVPQGPLLYEDDNVKIYYKELTDTGVAFEVENLSDITWAIQSNDLTLNGTHFGDSDIIMSDEIAPHSIGVAVAQIDFSDSSIETISGTIRVVDIAVFDGYDAPFSEMAVA